jgi:hypothetical protein
MTLGCRYRGLGEASDQQDEGKAQNPEISKHGSPGMNAAKHRRADSLIPAPGPEDSRSRESLPGCPIPAVSPVLVASLC